MDFGRVLKHLVADNWSMHHAFSGASLANIERVIGEEEGRHGGEIRFAVEGGMPLTNLLRGDTPRARAIELFSHMRVWDTEGNCGVLIYVSLGDRDVEIVADRGLQRHVGEAGWHAIVESMEAHFREGRFEKGVVEGIRAISGIMARHFPRQAGDQNELPDAPLVL